jgi:hypothetical protein
MSQELDGFIDCYLYVLSALEANIEVLALGHVTKWNGGIFKKTF